MRNSIVVGVVLTLVTALTAWLVLAVSNGDWLVERHKTTVADAIDDAARKAKELSRQGDPKPPTQTEPRPDAERAALRDIASGLSREVGRSDYKILVFFLVAGITVGVWTGVFLTHLANRGIIGILEQKAVKIVKDVDGVAKNAKSNIRGTIAEALEAARSTADHIRCVFESMQHKRLYLMSEAHRDLLLSRYTFVLGKLTYLMNDGSNSLLSEVREKGIWCSEDHGIAFIVTKHMGYELMSVCRKLATFKDKVPEADDYKPQDLSEAYVAIIDGMPAESFPLQLVSYMKESSDKILHWGPDMILSLLADEQVNTLDIKQKVKKKALRELTSEIVAFLDDLVSQIAKAGDADHATDKRSDYIEQLIGIRMYTTQQTEALFGAFHKIVCPGEAETPVINLGRLVGFCKKCAMFATCRERADLVDNDCVALEEDPENRGGWILKDEVLEEVR